MCCALYEVSCASQTRYAYKIKIINPQKKSDVIVRQLHDTKCRFESVVVLRAKLIEEVGDQVPNTITFDVGYYGGQQHSKIWLCSDKDLDTMYCKHPSGDITLWCDGRVSSTDGECSKRKRDDPSIGLSKRQKKEEEVDSVFKELKEKHGTKYDTPRLRLWARMVTSNLHDDFENPPNIPAFCSTPKRQQQMSLSTAISGAATAVMKALAETPQKDNKGKQTELCGVSPGKAVDLRMKNYQQLRYIQQLYDDGILSAVEYNEQKQSILAMLRKL